MKLGLKVVLGGVIVLIACFCYTFFINTPNSVATQSVVFSPVSIAEYKSNSLISVDYNDLFLVKLNRQKNYITKIMPPQNVEVWNPTGAAYSHKLDEIFIANYTGSNILILKYDEVTNRVTLIDEMKAPGMKSPENVAISEDGQLVVVADYDADKVYTFNRDGKLLWERNVGEAHGIAIDDKYIYATGLQQREVVKFDLRGRTISKVGSLGWGDNKYLWPTHISIYKDELIITDTHSGKISFLTKDLKFIRSIGGNGPGSTMFNYPYSSLYLNNQIIVADTFKKRLALVNSKGGIISQLSTGEQIPSGKYKYKLGGKEGLEYTYPDLTMHDINSKLFNPFFNEQNQVVAGFNSIDLFNKTNGQITQLEIDVPNSPYYLGKSYWYTTWTHSVEYNNSEYIIIGSPQKSSLIIISTKHNTFHIVENYRSKYDMWKIGKDVFDVSGKKIDFSGVIKDAEELFNKFDFEISNGKTRTEAYRNAFYPSLSQKEFQEWLTTMMVTEQGKKFLQNFNESEDGNERAAVQYFIEMLDEQNQFLFENLLVRMLGYNSGNIVNLNSLSTVTAERTPYDGFGIEQSMDDNKETYTGYQQNSKSNSFELTWNQPIIPKYIFIQWYSEDEIGTEFEIQGVSSNGKRTVLAIVNGNKSSQNTIALDDSSEITKLIFIYHKGAGQNRLLTREFKVFGMLSSEGGTNLSTQSAQTETSLTDQELTLLAVKTSKLLDYSGALDYENLGLNNGEDLQKILLEEQRGMCGDYSYLFTRSIADRNKWRFYDVETTSGAIHSIVEVWSEDGKWRVYDPTLGISYRFSFSHLIDKPEDSKVDFQRQGFEAYIGPNLFENISFYRVYTNLDMRDSNRLKPALVKSVEGKGFYTGYEAENIFSDSLSFDGKYASGDSSRVSIKFKPSSVYRATFYWYDKKRYFQDFELVFYYLNKEITRKRVQYEKSPGFRSDIYLDRATKADRVELIVNNSVGTPEFLLKKFFLY